MKKVTDIQEATTLLSKHYSIWRYSDEPTYKTSSHYYQIRHLGTGYEYYQGTTHTRTEITREEMEALFHSDVWYWNGPTAKDLKPVTYQKGKLYNW